MHFTPSSFPRLQRCLGAAVLPQAEEVREGMERGTAMHAHIERMANGATRPESLAQVPEQWRADAAAIDLEPAMLRNGAAEVAFALNLERGTARELGRGLSRSEARALLTPGEISMIADWVAISGEAFVCDWKSGIAEGLVPAPRNAQLLTYMAAALLAYRGQGVTAVRGALVRVDRDAPYWERTGAMDALDVEGHLESVRALLGRAKEARARYSTRGEVPPLAVGVHCDWCSARRFCPAQVGQLHEALGFQPKEGSEFGGPVLRPAEAGAMYAKVLGALEVLKRFKADLEGIAKEEPLPLPDGRVLRWEDEAKASVDVAAAAPVLARAYGQSVVDLATRRHDPTMPWDALAAALATEALPRLQEEHHEKGGRKPTRGALIREARNLLEQNNAVRVHHYSAPRVVEVRGELPPGADT
jgi:hypothetical protein